MEATSIQLSGLSEWWMSPTGMRWSRGLLIAVILLGAALRVYQLGQDSLWLDEIHTQEFIGMRPSAMLEAIIKSDVHPPLFYLIAYVNRMMLGNSDFVARVPSVFAGILSIPAMFVLGRRLWSGPAGLLTGLLIAIWPAHLHYSQEARQYALLTLLVIFSMYWLYRGLITGQVRAWLGYSLAIIISLYTHYFAFPILAAQGTFVLAMGLVFWLRSGQPHRFAILRQSILPFAASLIVSAIAYLPWYRSLLIQRTRIIRDVSLPVVGSAASLPYTKMMRTIARSVTEGQSTLGIVLLAIIAVGLVSALIRRQWTALLCAVMGFVVPVLTLGFVSSPANLYAWHVFPLLVPLLVLAAQGLMPAYLGGAKLLERVSGSKPVVLTLLMLPVIAFLARFDVAYYKSEKEDWRGAAVYLDTHKSPGDVIVGDGMFYMMGGDAERVRRSLGYYLHDETAVIKSHPGLTDRLPEDTKANGTAWGVIWYQGRLADRRPLADSIEFTDFENLVVLRLKHPSRILWADTAAILEAMLQLQPHRDTHTDLHLALAQLYVKMGDRNLASRHVTAAAETMPKNDDRLEKAFLEIQRQLRAE